jgi:hypothetical protein
MLDHTINSTYFNPWNNVDRTKQQSLSKILSYYLNIQLYTDYKLYNNMTEDEIYKECYESIKFCNKVFLWYCNKYPEFKMIKLPSHGFIFGVVHGIISKFNFEDIKFFIEEYTNNTYRSNKFRIEYDRKRNMIKKKLKIEFGFIPSPETLNKLIEHFDLKIKPFKL